MKLAYVDSSVWIARFEGLVKYRHKIDEELARLAQDGFSFTASDAVLLETLVKPAQERDTTTIEVYRQVFQQLRLAPVYPDVFIDALEIAKTELLKSMDAVHVALALNHECECFVSTDGHFKNLKILCRRCGLTWRGRSILSFRQGRRGERIIHGKRCASQKSSPHPTMLA